ncbi:MAG: hypothetical protein IKP77_01825 [Acholeplasmatales bacterium]|nr:hypothetical protein [Acholeplasmatales bacterium]
MTNLLALVKIEFSKAFSKNSIKENKAKSASFFSIIGLVILLGIGLSSLYSYIYGKVFLDAGASLLPLTLMFSAVASMLSLYSGITQSRGIFIGNDYDMLVSLPLTKREIIASKVINLYLVELLYTSIIMLPHGVVNVILSGDTMYLFTSIILSVFVSAFPLVIAMIFSFITAIISSKFKYGNFVAIGMYVIFLGAIFMMSFTISSSHDTNAQATALTNIANIIKWLNPAIYFVQLAHTTNYLFIFIFVAINVVSLILVILVFALFYDKIHEVVNSLNSDYKYERKVLKTKKELRTLLGLEFKRLISSKMYFINSIVGLIMSLFMAVFMGLVFSKYSPFGMSDELYGYVQQYAFAGGIIVAFGISITNPSTVGISIEGKNFWLIKSLPINYKKYMWAKLLLSLILILPVSIISSTIIVIFIQPDLISILSIYLIPILVTILDVVLSLLINLTFYKLRWKSEQEVVKSSSSVVIAMLIGFGIDIVMIGLLVGLGIVMKPLGVFVTIGALFVASLILFITLKSVFVKKIIKIEDF